MNKGPTAAMSPAAAAQPQRNVRWSARSARWNGPSRAASPARRPGLPCRRLLAACLCVAGCVTGSAIAVPVAQAAAPLDGSAPLITGPAVDAQRLKVSKGAWEGSRPISYAYRWSRCDAAGASCVDIPAAPKPTYKLTHADVGHTLRALVSASDSGGEGSAETQPSELVAPASLKQGKRPAVSGIAKDGQVLSVGNGTWKGTPPQSFAYQWQSCTRSGACSDIPGATGSSYRVATEQIGTKLRALVTATNALGEASAVSRASKPAVAGPPVELVAPVVSGNPQEGQTLSATPGEWAGTAPISYAYQWLRCSVIGGGCQEIPGATSSTYTAGGSDPASNLAVVVTATNAQGSVAGTSPETQPILGILPTNTVLPSISGLLQDGQLLSVATGVWSGTAPILYGYQWQLCNALGQACNAIEGATGPSLALDPSEIGKTLDVLVTATNVAGSSSATSSLTSLIAGILPSNTALPSIAGVLQDGSLLSASTGSWTGSEPLSYSYQWQLCNALGQVCKAIEGATGSSLKLDPSEIGKTLALVVTATNAAGSTMATSTVTGLIAGILPKNTTPPAISGLLKTGQLLSVTNGTWTGSDPISYTYQWQLCLLGTCTDIAKATGQTFLLSGLSLGSTLRAVVTAKNAAGSVPASSAITGPLGL
jgi:hypothetical protein